MKDALSAKKNTGLRRWNKIDKCNLCRYYQEPRWCLNPKGMCDFKWVSKKDYKDRLLSEYDIIRAIDRHTRKDGTLNDNILVILEEVKTAKTRKV